MREKGSPECYDLKVKEISAAEFQDNFRKSMEMQRIVGILAAREKVIEVLKRNGFHDKEAMDISHGNGLRIALVNSGVDITHDEIAERFVEGRNGENFVDWTYDEKQDLKPCKLDPNEIGSISSHGICVAGILAAKSFGIIRKPKLYIAKVCDDKGTLRKKP